MPQGFVGQEELLYLVGETWGPKENGACFSNHWTWGQNPWRPCLAQPPWCAGAKLDREFVPGVKLKFENKKPIVGLAVHPSGGCAAAAQSASWPALLWQGPCCWGCG